MKRKHSVYDLRLPNELTERFRQEGFETVEDLWTYMLLGVRKEVAAGLKPILQGSDITMNNLWARVKHIMEWINGNFDGTTQKTGNGPNRDLPRRRDNGKSGKRGT